MQKRYWFELSQTLIECFKVAPLNSTLKNLPLEVFITAVSGFSGPIALLADKEINHQFILPDKFNESIILLTCRGELKKTVPFKMKDKIIFFGFTKWEELLVVDASGDYWLIDPFSGSITHSNYSKEPLISLPGEIAEHQERYRGCVLLIESGRLVMLR